MSTASPPLGKAEEEAAAGAPAEVPTGDSANYTPKPLVPPLPPAQAEPEVGPRAQCQAWLVEMLDDVRYLISCTNWY